MATPPELTGFTGIITNQPTITWTPDTVYESAITEIRVGNDKVLEYTISSGEALIDRDSFRMAETYTITIIATGYDNATATVTLALANWTRYILFDNNDLKNEEPQYLQDETDITLGDIHDMTLFELGQDLENQMYRNNEFLKELEGTNYTLLNYIYNPLRLKRPAMYLALKNIFDKKRYSENDPYAIKFYDYSKKYNNALRSFPKHIEFSDTDANENEIPPQYRRAIYPNVFPTDDIGKARFTR